MPLFRAVLKFCSTNRAFTSFLCKKIFNVIACYGKCYRLGGGPGWIHLYSRLLIVKGPCATNNVSFFWNNVLMSECAKTYTDDNFRIIGQARSSFHLGVLESVYIKTRNPVLCRQRVCIFFKALQLNNNGE